MSLEATHIRFALDLRDKYQVQDMEKYIAGTVYPDSRYVTKIDRELTHNDNILKSRFAKDDFTKGWQAHQLCDLSFGRLKYIVFPDSFSGTMHFGDEQWILSTVIKIIQDMNDMQRFPMQDYLKYLDFVHNPNGEDIEEVRKYNQIMIDLYKDKKTTTEDYYRMWLALGVDKELGLKVKNKTEEILKDTDLVEKIENVYIDMIDDYQDIFITSE